MDAALQKLGQGIEPADCSLWRTANPVSVNRKAGTIRLTAKVVPALFHRHQQYCQKTPALFRRPGVGRAHKNRITVDVLFGMQKNQKRCIIPK